MITSASILKFWFEELGSERWWVADPVVDEKIRHRFQAVLAQASRAEMHTWRTTAKGRLAEIIVLDQFSRNIYRNTPNAFSQDAMALVLAQEAVSANALAELSASERSFLLMPFMHSESKLIHEQAAALFKQFTTNDSYQFELKHQAIIDRFGRYPHRNKILGRASTPAELTFLQQPDSSF